jgi:hypothetical protein
MARSTRRPIPDWYPAIAAAIAQRGYFTNGIESMDGWQRTTICSKQLVAGSALGGNSFWTTILPSGCYLGMWSPRPYRLPEADRLPDLCAEWFALHHDDCPPDFDRSLKERFGLVTVSDAEFDELASR